MRYKVKSSYGHTATFNDLAKAKAFTYLVCAEAPNYGNRKECAYILDEDKNDKEIYRVWRINNTITEEVNGRNKTLSMIVPDKYRTTGKFVMDVWPYQFYYGDAEKKPSKYPLPGTQYFDLAIYYVAKDIRNGKYKNGIIYYSTRKLKHAEINPINKNTFEIKKKIGSGSKYKTVVRTWSEIVDSLKGF